MQGKSLFEYAVIRLVPKVEREEFLNVGVVLYCASAQFLQCRFFLDEKRLLAFSSDLDLVQIKENLQAFAKICHGTLDSGPIGQLDLPSRFRWLTATRSTVIQVSKVHPGFCGAPEKCLENLLEDLVL